tara:strand:+ start:180 stop:422 length:243 start_codon:yes stop_codon:yes gene_type:complete
MEKDFIWMGRMPGVCGYGICVIGKTKQGAEKSLKNAYYKWRKDSNGFGSHMDTYNKAMDYFGGWVEKKYFGFDYFDDFAE